MEKIQYAIIIFALCTLLEIVMLVINEKRGHFYKYTWAAMIPLSTVGIAYLTSSNIEFNYFAYFMVYTLINYILFTIIASRQQDRLEAKKDKRVAA